MKRTNTSIALCTALDIAGDGDVPEWVHLLPAGEIRTVDGRGPYRVTSLQSVIDASLKPGDKLPIDENHATDKGAALGLAAPARGWIVELQARQDGLWGRVEWTGEGAKLMADKAYRGISPAILHTAAKTVVGVLRASLTNTPNLQGMVSLHSEDMQMDWKAKLIELLGLDSGADDAAIEAALKAKMTGGDGGKMALCAQDVLTLPQFVALQSQLTEITGKYNALTETTAIAASTTFVDAAIAAGRVGLKPVRDEYIALHMQDAGRAEKLIGSMPVLKGEVIVDTVQAGCSKATLNKDDHLVMSLFGVSEDEYREGLKASGLHKEAL